MATTEKSKSGKSTSSDVKDTDYVPNRMGPRFQLEDKEAYEEHAERAQQVTEDLGGETATK